MVGINALTGQTLIRCTVAKVKGRGVSVQMAQILIPSMVVRVLRGLLSVMTVQTRILFTAVTDRQAQRRVRLQAQRRVRLQAQRRVRRLRLRQRLRLRRRLRHRLRHHLRPRLHIRCAGMDLLLMRVKSARTSLLSRRHPHPLRRLRLKIQSASSRGMSTMKVLSVADLTVKATVIVRQPTALITNMTLPVMAG